MDPVLREMLDKQEISEVLHRYCRAVDRADEELLRTVYHPDALDEHGFYNGGIDGMIEFLYTRTLNPKIRPNPTRHILSNIAIEVDGDTAWAESYNTVQRVDDNKLWIEGAGRYVDRFERRDGEWRIAHRRVVIEYAGEHDVSTFHQSARDRRDLVYDRTVVTLAEWQSEHAS